MKKTVIQKLKNYQNKIRFISASLSVSIIMCLIKYNLLHQIILWLLITYVIKAVPMSIVYAETLLDFLPRQSLDTYDDPFYHPTTFQGAGVPHRTITNDVRINNESDGNMTCEDAAYNERHPSSEVTEAHISKELTIARINYVNDMVLKTLSILERGFSEDAVNKDLIDDVSIKNVTFYTLTTHGNISEWVVKTEAQLKDALSEVNLRTALIQRILEDNTLHSIERKILCHLATSMSIVSSAEILHLDINGVQFKDFLTSEVYTTIYTKFNINHN